MGKERKERNGVSFYLYNVCGYASRKERYYGKYSYRHKKER